ncbi:MAG TPA: hypothetical protein VD962_10045 [Rubricoccaceae bacterium]|nr:hypothetical protein [Rubricoccaceae bacterium]
MRALAVLCLLSAVLCLPVRAQPDVVELLRRQRLEARFGELMVILGDAVPPRPFIPHATTDPYLLRYEALVAARHAAYADSVARARADSLAEAARLTTIRWHLTPADDQGGFLERYREVFWQAAFSQAPMDSVSTPVLRARLGTLFGAPTRNAAAAEQEGYAGSEFVQFEYWLVANDTIPVLVLDIDGPFGRGLLIAGDEDQAALMPALKADLSARLLADGLRATPFADYYQSSEREQWYRTGFDGTQYFVTEVRPPRWARQRREGQKWIIHR